MGVEEIAAPARVAAEEPYKDSLIRFRAAVVLSFLAQFLPFTVEYGSGMLDHETNTDYYTGITMWSHAAESGWHTHAVIALIGLPVLAWVYFAKGRFRPWWIRHGHWAALAILGICGMGDLHTWGARLGVIAIALAVWGVVLRRRELAMAAPAI